MFIDAARFAENSYFIKQKEKGYSDRSCISIAQEMFKNSDGILMSCKKDAFSNIGGFLALSDSQMAEYLRSIMVLTLGFPTYGGLTGRDLEAISVGLEEILDEDYLRYRIQSTAYFAQGLEDSGFCVVRPFGGHAVYIDAKKSLSHIPPLEYPGQALSVALYQHLGLRSVEVGSVMLGRKDPETNKEIPASKELVRLALPRRVYTQSHVDYILEKSAHLVPYFEGIKGYKIIYQPPFLRHFTAKFSPL